MISKPPHNVFTGLTATIAISLLSVSSAAAQSSVNEEAYAALLQEIADMKLTLAQQDVYLKTQEARMSALEGQIAAVEETKTAVGPMISKMVASIDNEITTDIPFKPEERFNRLGALRELVDDKEASVSDKIRRAFRIYDIEVGYGQTLEAYDGDHPDTAKAGVRRAACLEDLDSSGCALTKNLQERLNEGASVENLADEIFDGTYLRYGRLALAYMDADGSETLRYDVDSKSWVRLSGNKALDVRRGIRIARGEAAPGVVTAPVLVSN